MTQEDMIRRGISKDYFYFSRDFSEFKFIPKEIAEEYKKIYSLGDKWVKEIFNKEVEDKFGVFIYGNVYSGKSSFGCNLLRECKKNGMEVLRVTTEKILTDFYKEYKLPKVYSNRIVLFVDDLTREISFSNEKNTAIFWSLLKYRIENNLPIIISCAGSIENIRIKYGDSIVDLIKGRSYPIKMPDFNISEKLSQVRRKEFFKD